MIALLLAAALAGTPMEITAYTHTGNRTASGVWPAPGMAACPRRFPFGTRLHVAGVGVVTCQDRGGAIRGNRLDLFMATRAQAVRFGRRVRIVNGPLAHSNATSRHFLPTAGVGHPQTGSGVRNDPTRGTDVR